MLAQICWGPGVSYFRDWWKKELERQNRRAPASLLLLSDHPHIWHLNPFTALKLLQLGIWSVWHLLVQIHKLAMVLPVYFAKSTNTSLLCGMCWNCQQVCVGTTAEEVQNHKSQTKPLFYIPPRDIPLLALALLTHGAVWPSWRHFWGCLLCSLLMSVELVCWICCRVWPGFSRFWWKLGKTCVVRMEWCVIAARWN